MGVMLRTLYTDEGNDTEYLIQGFLTPFYPRMKRLRKKGIVQKNRTKVSLH